MKPLCSSPRWRSGAVLFIDITRGSSKPPRSSPPPAAFRRGLLHQHNSTGGSSEPPRSSPPSAVFWCGSLRRHHWGQQRTPSLISTADGIPAWSFTSTALGAAANCLPCLHRRRCSGMVLYIDNKGATPHLLARLHCRWLLGVFINIDATRSGASPPRSSTPPTFSRHLHRHHKEKHLASLVVYTANDILA